jgi:hypothetical protein
MEHNPNVWFSPAKILYYYALRESQSFTGKSRDEIKQMKEARQVAIALLAIIKFHNRNFWMQLVDSKTEQTPDLRTCCYNLQNNVLEIQEIELVTYEEHSDTDVANFIIDKKLSGKKSYTDNTAIICYINKTIRTEPWIKVHEKLKEGAKLNNDTFLVGRTSPYEHIYQVAQIHPKISIIETVNIIEMTYNHKMPNTILLKRAKLENAPKFVYTSEKIIPF